MSAIRKNLLVVPVLVVALALQGCAGTSGDQIRQTATSLMGNSGSTPSSGSGSSTDLTKTGVELGGALIGGGIGVAVALALARADGRRLHLSEKDIEKRRKGYLITFGLLGTVGGAVLAGTVYGKLKEQGKAERERALVAAASQAKPQRYGEPSDPSVAGTIVPGRQYAAGANKECKDLEDRLSDGSSTDSIFVKMCRPLPNGNWTQESTA